MFRVSALTLAGATVACNSTQEPPIYPDFVFPDLVVDEGGSTTFLLQLTGPPSFQMNGTLYTGDRTVARVMPEIFDVSPSLYPLRMSVEGIDDMMAAGNRRTGFNGRFEDNGTYGGGEVLVVDKQSQNVLSDSWSIIMTASATSTVQVQLAMPPTAAATVNLEPLTDGSGIVSFMPTTIVFGPTDYNVPQTITVSSGTETGTAVIGLIPADVKIPSVFVAVTVTQ